MRLPAPSTVILVLLKFWAIKSTGTLSAATQSHEFTQDYLKSIIQEDNGSYVAKLLCKDDHASLPSNFKVIDYLDRGCPGLFVDMMMGDVVYWTCRG